MDEYLFSFVNYGKMLETIISAGGVKDYSEITSKDEKFIILRHDVEFSPKRAYDLAVVESKYSIFSTFFFQISNNAYNILSEKNKERIKEIMSMGHKVGLHFHRQGSNDLEEIKQRIQYESDVMSYILHTKIDRFSFHRPSQLVLENEIRIPGMINAYAPLYFTFTKGQTDVDFTKGVKYIADSRNQWSYLAPYTSPSPDFFEIYPKVQILCHPYSWTEKGYETLYNLKSLIEENKEEFVDTLNSETVYVKEYINEL